MKYTVKAKMVTYLTAEVEADSFEEAYELADNMDGGEFSEDISGFYDPDGWSIYSIEDENGETEIWV